MREYVRTVRWVFARTMPDWPHEYTVKEWRPDSAGDFQSFCRLVHTYGVIEPWPPAPAATIYRNRYLVLGDWKYWSMGPQGDEDRIEDKTVINRESVMTPTRTADGP